MSHYLNNFSTIHYYFRFEIKHYMDEMGQYLIWSWALLGKWVIHTYSVLMLAATVPSTHFSSDCEYIHSE